MCVHVINSDNHPYSFKNNFHCPGIFLLYYSVISLRIFFDVNLMFENYFFNNYINYFIFVPKYIFF